MMSCSSSYLYFWSLFYRPFQTIIVQKQYRAPCFLLYFLIAILAFILRKLNDFIVILKKETLPQDFSGNEMLTGREYKIENKLYSI